MQLGPKKTDVSAFKGFGFGLKPGAAKAGAKAAPAPAARRPGAAKPAVNSLFAEALKEDDKPKSASSSAGLSYLKPTPEALQAQRLAAEALAKDPTAFQYDEVLDSIHEERGNEALTSRETHTDVLTQKKRTGLHVPVADTEVRTGTKRSAKYIEKVLVACDRRKVEQQIIEDKLLKKDKDARKDAEVFVTAAFKEELKKRQKFVDELEAQEKRDELKAAEKQENGAGFADFHRGLLNSGLASSRGANLEKAMEKAAPREEVKTEVKEEAKDVVKEEKQEDTKEEPDAGAAKAEVKAAAEPGETDAGFGVQDAAPIEPEDPESKKARKEEEQVRRCEKTMSAKERFLARKAAAAAAQA